MADETKKKKGGCLRTILGGICIVLVLLLALSFCGKDSSDDKTTEPPAQTEQQSTENPLMKAEFFKADVKTGIGDNVIGERGFINVSKSDLKSVTNEQFTQFAEEKVKDSGLNCVSIICEDGTGICFAGSNSMVAEYGELDKDGAILKSFGTIMLTEDGYTYTSVSDEEQTQQEQSQTTPQFTLAQQNAIAAAESYLEFTAFSRSGLIGQLEYEGYSTEDATFAVDNITVDWNEQAAKMAQQYLDYSSFSRSGLIDQLVYEGFTSEQAEYGVTAVGY